MGRYLKKSGFTLAELLIALAILGVIAAFTIPKVLSPADSGRYKAIAKDVAAMVAMAYGTYQMNGAVNANTRIADLTPYMNYVKLETVGSIDKRYGQTGTWDCDATMPCLLLHNGARLGYFIDDGTVGKGNRFGGTSPTNYIYFVLDPDGKVTDPANPTTANGKVKAADFILYYSGNVRLINDCQAGDITYDNLVAQNWCPNTASYPDWYSW